MTSEEQAMLIGYLELVGEIEGAADFDDWYRQRWEPVSGEVYYKAILQAARLVHKLRAGAHGPSRNVAG